MQQTMRRLVRVMPVEQVELVLGTLGDQAGVIGAACFAAQKYRYPRIDANERE